jgi:hypothetical protein
MEGHKSEGSTPYEPGPSIKRPYSPPRLSEFGSVQRLSRAGTGLLTEGPGSMNAKKRP